MPFIFHSDTYLNFFCSYRRYTSSLDNICNFWSLGIPFLLCSPQPSELKAINFKMTASISMPIPGSLHSFPGLVIIIEGNIVVSDALLSVIDILLYSSNRCSFCWSHHYKYLIVFASLRKPACLHLDPATSESTPRLTRGCLIVAASAPYARIPCSV